jgi:hypothetical protein
MSTPHIPAALRARRFAMIEAVAATIGHVKLPDADLFVRGVPGCSVCPEHGWPCKYVAIIVDAAMEAVAAADHETTDDAPRATEDPGYARQLMAAGIISAAAAQKALADKSHHNGKAEHLGIAEWLEDFATSLLHLGK